MRYPTPEEAARGDIPERYATVLDVSISPDGRDAVVALGTNEEPQLYPIESVCYRDEHGRWEEASCTGGIGLGWSPHARLEGDRAVGVLRLAGEAPEGTSEAIVRWRDEERTIPVVHGFFFFTEWRVPADYKKAVGEPQIVRFIDL